MVVYILFATSLMKIGRWTGICRTWAKDMVMNWSDPIRNARPSMLVAIVASYFASPGTKSSPATPENIAA